MVTHIIGSSGFIGNAIRKQISDESDYFFYSSKFKNEFRFDIDDTNSWNNLKIKKGDKLIFLTWQNLPNYNKVFHITDNLKKSILFF